MFLQEIEITGESTVRDIVKRNYRTADVFHRYGIEYCCGAKWPLSTVCMMKGIEEKNLLEELRQMSRNIQLSPALPFHQWSIDFLADYIVNVHHSFLKLNLPPLESLLEHFTNEHEKKFPYFLTIQAQFRQLQKDAMPHLKHEEEVIFPYIKQVAHAYQDKDSLAGLLVKTLRKPVARLLDQEHELFSVTLLKFRELTDNYTPPEKACSSHQVVLSKLKELDADLAQHIFLETGILFPRIIAMEKELLSA